VGSRLPAYCTSMGRVLLASLEDEEVLRRLKASRPKALTKHTVTDVDTLLSRVQQVRRQGWSLVNQELEEGLISLAAPITDRSGRTIAALNLSGQANRTNTKVAQETLLPALQRAARTISQRLG
jgi:IclR family pca regulon transcriptional regulator